MTDYALPIVFTQYLVAVPKDKCLMAKRVPDFIASAFGVGFTDDCKLSDVGHAGILFWSSSGTTKYYEFGRYGPSSAGQTRRVPMANLPPGPEPDRAALATILHRIAATSGQGGVVSGVLVETPGKFASMRQYAERRAAAGTGRGQNEYDLLSNNCGTFVADVLAAGGVSSVKYQQPDEYLTALRRRFPDVEYNPRTRVLTIETPAGSTGGSRRLGGGATLGSDGLIRQGAGPKF